jgi:DNA-binding SARP family transcriptional activator
VAATIATTAHSGRWAAAGAGGGGRYEEAAGTLRRALGLWRGGVLADLADYGFTRPEAARLEELRLAAAEARIDADLALGRHDALTAELEQLAGEHPMRERLHGQLMLALYRGGRQGDALAAYRWVRDLLAGEPAPPPVSTSTASTGIILAHGLPCMSTNMAKKNRTPSDSARSRSWAPASDMCTLRKVVAIAPWSGGRAPVRRRQCGRPCWLLGMALSRVDNVY